MPEVQPPSDEQRQRQRTADVRGSAASFADLLLPPLLVRNLHAAGFWQPSPVQQAAVPLGRFGADLIVQAKSGTGKTVTFGVVVADAVTPELSSPQALIVEPTREVALQVQRTISALCKDMSCAAFVGGLPTHADAARLRAACHIVVATPGRLRALIQDGVLCTDAVRIMVLDEADTLLTGGFVDDVAHAYGALPKRKQVLAFSATYTEQLLAQLRQLMSCPQEVMLCPQTVTLRGVKQLYLEVSHDATGAVLFEKEAALTRLLSTLSFNQTLVFCNLRGWAEALADRLTQHGFPAAFTCGSLLQRRRMAVMDAARAFRVRVLVSTDLNARGLDLPYVNLVINVDVPANDATYLHRVGRTGRFGSSGVAVSLVTPLELQQLQGIVARANGELQAMPAEVPASWYATELPPEQQAALQELQPRPGRALRPILPSEPGTGVSQEQQPAFGGWEAAVEPPRPHTDDVAARWANWHWRQAAYSYWWWRWARLAGTRRSAPWAVPPWPPL